MAATVRGAIRELIEQTMVTMDTLHEASDRKLAMLSSHACAQGGTSEPSSRTISIMRRSTLRFKDWASLNASRALSSRRPRRSFRSDRFQHPVPDGAGHQLRGRRVAFNDSRSQQGGADTGHSSAWVCGGGL
jgi:hypothetical protein